MSDKAKSTGPSVRDRAERHAALGDVTRLAIVDALSRSDRSPRELRLSLGIESNLLTHHLDVLERVGLVRRSSSSGDRRRRYVHLLRDWSSAEVEQFAVADAPVFVCTANSARSQLAVALWRNLTSSPATSAGTHPASRVHPRALAAGRRAGLDMSGAIPRPATNEVLDGALVITVCDQAHEELRPTDSWVHWSVPDPVTVGTDRAFDQAVKDIRTRVEAAVRDRELLSSNGVKP